MRQPGDVQAFKDEIAEYDELKKRGQQSAAEKLLTVAWFFDGLMPSPSSDNPYIVFTFPEIKPRMTVSDTLIKTLEMLQPNKYTVEERQEISLLTNIALGAAMERTGKVPVEYEEAVEAAVNWMSRAIGDRS